MLISDEQMATLNDFHSFCCRHMMRSEMRAAIGFECCKVVGVDKLSIEGTHMISIALWLVKPEVAIKRIVEG
jgi:hypothetical protein